MRDLSLTTRSEGTREPRPVADPVQFTLAQIKAHFDESLASIQSQFDVAEDLKTNGKTDECKDIWRSQIVFLEGILDFYLHQISKYALYQMFLERWTKSKDYEDLQISIREVEVALKSIENSETADESKKWFYEYLNNKFYYNSLVPLKYFQRQIKLLDMDFSDIMKTAFSTKNDGERFMKNFSSRRNDIAHRFDRSLSSAEKNDISREYVEECISGVRSIVYAIHNKAEEKDRTSL